MGSCELCGKGGTTKSVKIEDSIMDVCSGCAKFGTAIKPPKSGTIRLPPKRTITKKPIVVQLLVSDYHSVIKKKREALNMKQEHLAKRMGIKESMIHKVESKRVMPPDSLVKKFEKALGINLFEKDD